MFDKKGKKVAGEKLLFRTETEIERKNWVSAINKLTQNLVEDIDKEGPEKFDLFNDNLRRETNTKLMKKSMGQNLPTYGEVK